MVLACKQFNLIIVLGSEMKAVALFSGGKDSTYALYLALQQGYDIAHLVTIKPRVKDSYMYHIPMVDFTSFQADAMGIPHDVYTIGDDMDELRDILRNYDADAVVSGAIASNYQKSRIEEVCTSLGLISYTPLWGKNQTLLMKDLIMAGLEVMIVSVSAYGLDEKFLGKIIDVDILTHLINLESKYGINVSGEGGEYETYVLYAPFFRKRLHIKGLRTIWLGSRGFVSFDGIEVEDA